ncbi:helix-turn-helix domain-containing protein [Methylobacterium brachythecii]|uniref:helix-turn-helix domain-containing protein n=1 Tax=Methylobacterium brachythecii TaxID=1176177 RepID=UPI00161B949B|nr:helix-turn-helix domain-containing protein [Methylobacterium brachythecii]
MSKVKACDPAATPAFSAAAFSVEIGAEYLGISRSSVWRLIKDGALPCARLKGRTLLRRSDCDTLLERSTASSNGISA